MRWNDKARLFWPNLADLVQYRGKSLLLRLSFVLIVLPLFCLTTEIYAEKIPIAIGTGPILYRLHSSPEDGLHNYQGYSLYAKAIVSKEMIQRNKKKIPKKFRRFAKSTREIRIGSFWLPSELIISPKNADNNLSMFGLTWRNFSIGIPLSFGPFTLAPSASLLFTYLYFDLEAAERSYNMHFIRPGVDLRLTLTTKLGDQAELAIGAAGNYYIPQEFETDSIHTISQINQVFIRFAYFFEKSISI